MKLKCDMKEDCQAVVTHIDIKGWVYCAEHGKQRKYDMRCRKLRPSETKNLEMSEQIWY